MDGEEFFRKFTDYLKNNRKQEANSLLMTEIGRLMVNDRENFVYILKYSGINVPDHADDVDLINIFIKNINMNQKLMVATAFFIANSNKMVSFDGDPYTSNICADAIHKSMFSYFEGKRFCKVGFDGDYMNSYADAESKSNFDGDMADMCYDGERFDNLDADTIAQLGGKGLDLLGGIAANRGKNLENSNLPQQILKKKLDAKNALIQSVLDQKKAQQEALAKSADAEAKAKRTKVIAIASIGGAMLLIVGIIIIKKMRK